jgi:hypothetical protein
VLHEQGLDLTAMLDGALAMLASAREERHLPRRASALARIARIPSPA